MEQYKAMYIEARDALVNNLNAIIKFNEVIDMLDRIYTHFQSKKDTFIFTCRVCGSTKFPIRQSDYTYSCSRCSVKFDDINKFNKSNWTIVFECSIYDSVKLSPTELKNKIKELPIDNSDKIIDELNKIFYDEDEARVNLSKQTFSLGVEHGIDLLRHKLENLIIQEKKLKGEYIQIRQKAYSILEEEEIWDIFDIIIPLVKQAGRM